ncbi:Uncharacterised protein [Streptococcus pneumoniae]|nr:Uncharacterised protein [Streptococcus pneumoniae]COF60493.1 Uncharacterised protein [Streptococcus pneumoniae]COF77810.1 Uncharacterised protein [Streptococcus pneumoniae]
MLTSWARLKYNAIPDEIAPNKALIAAPAKANFTGVNPPGEEDPIPYTMLAPNAAPIKDAITNIK